MSFPLGYTGPLSGIILGLIFGYVLENAGFGSGCKLTAQLRFKDWAVFKVMFTAILVSAGGLYLLQGMGTRGWGGIPLQSGPFIRPLLEVSRSAIRAYAQEKGIPFREDASNADPAYLRNRVRHELMPLIGELRDGADAVLRRDMVRNRELAVVLDQWLEVSVTPGRTPLFHVRGRRVEGAPPSQTAQ